MRDRIVQLPRDPGALLHDSLAGGDVSLALGQSRAAVPVAYDAADDQHHDHGPEGKSDGGTVPVGRAGVPPYRQQVGQPDECSRLPRTAPVLTRPPGRRASRTRRSSSRRPPGCARCRNQRADSLRNHACGGRIALSERDGGADRDGEHRAEDLLVDGARSQRDLQQRDGGEEPGHQPVTLSPIAEPQLHGIKLIRARPPVIGQPDDAALAGNRPTGRCEDRPPWR